MRFFILFFTLLISSCVTIPGQYREPVTQGLAVVSNSSRSSGGITPKHWESYIVSKIDNKRTYYIDRILTDGFYAASWKVAAGRRIFEVRVQFNDRNLQQKTYQAYITFEAHIKPFARYRVAGQVENKNVTVWLIDIATGDKVSVTSTTLIEEPTE